MAPRGLGLGLLLLIASGGAAHAQGPCLRFGAPRQLGQFASPDIVESSGLAASPFQNGVRFTHNDSGDGPRLFAFDAAGTDLGAFAVTGAGHRDWEDLAFGPCAEADGCLFVGDVGDNAAERATVTVFRVPEPQVGVAAETAAAVQLDLTYPDGARDVEALLVDPRTGDLFLVEKSDTLAARVVVLRGAGSLAAGAHPLEDLGAMEFAGLATGGDFDPTGGEATVRTYAGQALRWLPRRDEAGRVTRFDLLDMPNVDVLGEALTYRADGLALLTSREAEAAPLFETPCASPDGTRAGPAVGPLVPTPPPEPESSGCGGGEGALVLPLGWIFGRRRRWR